VRFGIAIPSYGARANGPAVRNLLVATEQLGYASAWFPDHIAVPREAAGPGLSPPFFEPLTSCAYGLAITERLVLGTDILVGPYRHPLVVAAMAATMGHLAGNRLVLGVGIGYLRGEFAALDVGPYETRAARTEDFLRGLRAQPDTSIVLTAPAPVPVWVGGNSAQAERRAALLGDGWHPLWTSADQYAAARKRILALRTEAGLGGPFTFSYSCMATGLVDGRRPWSPPAPRPPSGSEFRYQPEAWVADDNRPRFVGTPDEVTADLRLLANAGVDHVVLRFGTADTQPLERFATDVMPLFDEESP
jgi:alkanesulfonate monooxygenase SsuD/methylene tetrahydromethanopterin reductase-like flavin-dependent oxidoreductase (luciferase family)